MRRLQQLDALRAIAALLVAFCHFRYVMDAAIQVVLEPLGNYGVCMFFVISGFIIPRVLASTEYKLSNIAHFLWKRVIRLHPPYLMALLLTLLLSYAAAHVKGSTVSWSTLSVIQYLFYVQAPYENPVFWTLQVEACYYIYIGLLFPLLKSDSPALRWAAFLASAAAALAFPKALLFLQFLGYFLVGIATERAQRTAYGIEFWAAVAIGLFTAWRNSDSVSALFAVATCLVIVGADRVKWPKPLLFVGAISYSFYLLHFPIGVKFLNLAVARTTTPTAWILLPTAFVLTLCASYILYRLIEKPMLRFSAMRKPQASMVYAPIS